MRVIRWALACAAWAGLSGCGQADSPGAGGPQASPTPAAVAAPAAAGRRDPLPPASSPEEAIQQLETALKSADFAALADIYAEPYGPLLVELNLARDLTTAQIRLARAMHARFGEEAGDPAGIESLDPVVQVKQLQSLSVVDKHQDGEQITLMVRTELKPVGGLEVPARQEPMLALKQGDRWRIVPPFIHQQGYAWLEQNLAEQQRVAGLLAGIAQQVERGHFASLPQVHQALQAALQPPAERLTGRPAESPQR